jgi:hypothetical protein
MENPSVDQFTRSVEDAKKRLFLKSLAFAHAYIFVLEAQKAALEGHGDLKKALAELESDLGGSNINMNQYFRSVLFVDLISEAEMFFAVMIKTVIARYPKKAGSVQFRLSDIIDATSLGDLITRASEDYIYKLLYKKPMEYLAEICAMLSIDQSIIEPYWPTYIEAKARRDLGAHNNWICNSTYLRKLEEAGVETSASEGQIMIPTDLDYAADVSQSIFNLAADLSAAVMSKHVSDPGA